MPVSCTMPWILVVLSWKTSESASPLSGARLFLVQKTSTLRSHGGFPSGVGAGAEDGALFKPDAGSVDDDAETGGNLIVDNVLIVGAMLVVRDLLGCVCMSPTSGIGIKEKYESVGEGLEVKDTAFVGPRLGVSGTFPLGVVASSGRDGGESASAATGLGYRDLRLRDNLRVSEPMVEVPPIIVYCVKARVKAGF